MGLNEPPATLGEWADAMSQLLKEADIAVGVEEMCTADSTRHEVRIGSDVQYFSCVLDTLLVPFVIDEPEIIDIRSQSPVSGDIIEIQASQDSIEVIPDDAVMSFGVAADVEALSDGGNGPVLAYDRFCPYVNAFSSEMEYEQWATETADAVTMGLPLKEGFTLAQTLAQRSSVAHTDSI
jgi:hypothetical protein